MLDTNALLMIVCKSFLSDIYIILQTQNLNQYSVQTSKHFPVAVFFQINFAQSLAEVK